MFRAAGLADHLRGRYGMYLNGLILVSGVLDFATLEGGTGNDLPYPLYLPAYTAAAHFHKKLPADLAADLDQALAESRAFARGEYPAALQAGAALPAAEREKVVAELARLTGLAGAGDRGQPAAGGPGGVPQTVVARRGADFGRVTTRG